MQAVRAQAAGMGFAAGASQAPPQPAPVYAPPAYAPPAYAAPPQPQYAAAPASNYAPFLARFFALLIDEFLAGAAGTAVASFVIGVGTLLAVAGSQARSSTAAAGGGLLWLIGVPLGLLVYVLYFVKQETGSSQATVGKRLLGIRITNMNGGTISTGQSLGRLLIKNSFSGLFLGIGFLMAAFTERKQALHDFVSSTLVVTKQ
jgi:uncharacterized RDD family membrane protein YckC